MCEQHECALCSGRVDLEALKKDEDARFAKYGWVGHFVTDDDPNSATGFNAHTHGLPKSSAHLDLQVVLPMPPEVTNTVLFNLADRIRKGEQFEPGQRALLYRNHHDIDIYVTFVKALENGRDVLRVIMPTATGALTEEEMNSEGSNFADQWKKLEGSSESDWMHGCDTATKPQTGGEGVVH